MKSVLKLEEAMLFIFGIVLFAQSSYEWWWFVALILLPDIGMLGYLINERIGAMLYNVFHHRGLAILIYLFGQFMGIPLFQLIGIILFAHIAMDRTFGYGLKYFKGFKYTHLGEIGKNNG